ncbi:hypothetical protein E8E12_005354 [Didymella heteroderae]|uniref:Uncharacterized protein n=1 Tax=Didymella heteroderae TaxID=1769908 RepID=A0A9P4WNM3_9PLEO|nr:hypothetical protein E8E12_005354 [Didymella heteroderae]
MASSDTTDYPPNTPDRPAPLSVKSRGSQISNSTPISTNILRSVSAPIRTQPQSDLRPLPQRDSTVKTGGTEALGLSVTAAKDSCRNRGGVFGAAHQRDSNRHNHFIDKLQSSEYRRYGTPGKYMYPDSDGRSLGPYQLDASDIASESSDGTFKSLRRKNRNQPSTGTSYDVGIIGYESFDALDSYIGSEDEEKGSILESASNTSEEAPTPYQFAVQQSPSKSIIAGPVPSPSEHRAAADARRNTQPPSISAQGVNFHRPLPLRSYESEAIMFPTADAQTNSSIRRSKSVTSIIASRRPAIETMAVPCVTNSLQARDSFEEQVDQEAASFSQRSSSASTLAAFPIPPMDNPVGQLPMLVSRAVSSPHSLRTTRSQHPVASASLEDTYRAIVQVAMDAVLQRTRSQAKGLPPVDWNRLTSFERAWREMNALLLVTIYGRTDAVLTETDIDYIDRVAEVLRNESADTESTNWVRRMFEAEN